MLNAIGMAAFFKLPESAALFSKRGFFLGPCTMRLELIGATFIKGFNDYQAKPGSEAVSTRLEMYPADLRGFYAEGTAMSSALMQAMFPWSRRLPSVLHELDARFAHLTHVGVGWAIARVPLASRHLQRHLEPLLSGLALDGRGFHDAYFDRKKWKSGRSVGSIAGSIYDQGIGRALWFRSGGDCRHVVESICGFEPRRQADLWAGLGLAVSYAGGIDEAEAGWLRQESGRNLQWFAQGSSFAIAACARAQHIPAHAQLAASVITGRDPSELPSIVEEARLRAEELPGSGLERYQEWRHAVACALGEV